MLLAREVGSFMNASAATRAVAAVPWMCIVSDVWMEGGWGQCCTYCVLHARDEYLRRVEALPVLPVYSCYPYCMFGTNGPTQGGEVIVGSIFAVCLVFVQSKGTMQ